MFRLVRTDPPTENDFLSHRAEYPKRRFPEDLRCRAAGVSVYEQRRDAVAARSSFPLLRGRRVCEVRLADGAGSIQQTGDGSHHTWWPFADYDILAVCTVDSP